PDGSGGGGAADTGRAARGGRAPRVGEPTRRSVCETNLSRGADLGARRLEVPRHRAAGAAAITCPAVRQGPRDLRAPGGGAGALGARGQPGRAEAERARGRALGSGWARGLAPLR